MNPCTSGSMSGSEERILSRLTQRPASRSNQVARGAAVSVLPFRVACKSGPLRTADTTGAQDGLLLRDLFDGAAEIHEASFALVRHTEGRIFPGENSSVVAVRGFWRYNFPLPRKPICSPSFSGMPRGGAESAVCEHAPSSSVAAGMIQFALMTSGPCDVAHLHRRASGSGVL